MTAPAMRARAPAQVGRLSLTRCPTCGGQVFYSRYIPPPERMRPGRRSRLLLDARPADPDDTYAQYAVQGHLGGVCRLITDDEPLDPPYERRHTHHFATHPACKPDQESR